MRPGARCEEQDCRRVWRRRLGRDEWLPSQEWFEGLLPVAVAHHQDSDPVKDLAVDAFQPVQSVRLGHDPPRACAPQHGLDLRRGVPGVERVATAPASKHAR